VSARLPFEIREAVVQVCGKAFWLKDPFRTFLLSCGVPAEIYDRFADESKYKIIRHVLAELDALGEQGFLVQRRIARNYLFLSAGSFSRSLKMDEILSGIDSGDIFRILS